MSDGFLFQAFVFLAAAVVAVPVAARLGLGSVLGYLLAGVAIGPFGFGFIAQDGQDILHFAEFGVVMMLFVIGLELQPALLWRLRGTLLGMGGLQVLLTTAAAAGIAVTLGQPWRAALAIGLILSLSSTAIVLQSLAERGYMARDAGQRAFAVLLFQDLAVIPMLALLPLLAAPGVARVVADAGHGDLLGEAPAWLRGLVVLGAVAAVVAGGRYLVQPLFRAIARTRLREVFTAAALLLVIGIALLMELVGLSPALGTFLAGVVLATSEFRHELESDIEPFKGLLLGLFFLAVGASIDFGLVRENASTVGALVFGLVAVKALVLFAIGRLFRMGLDHNLLFTAALAQGGEFGFVLLSYAGQNAVLPAEVANLLVSAIALSMATTPLMLVLYERVLAPRVGTRAVVAREADAIHGDSAVIIAGFGQFGSTIGRVLRTQGVRPVVLELDADRVELLRRIGLEVFYGDATRLELLHSAGIERARLLIIALGDDADTLALARTVRERHPHVRILARAVGRSAVFELTQAGVPDVYRDTFDSAVRVGTEALAALGTPRHHAFRLGQAFRRHDERQLRAMSATKMERGLFVDRLRENIRSLEETLLRECGEGVPAVEDAAWDDASLRTEAASVANPRGPGGIESTR
jgi:CPA2 family monovalent cation:H+ antiporter-2/glutathione-regulated potassium-efflux system protein KefB